MEFPWEEYETRIKNRYTRMVYSDDDDFYQEPTDPIYFIKKIGIYSYVVRYHTFSRTFTRYIIPHYNRKYADTILYEGGDKLSEDDIRNNENMGHFQIQ
jgi:hypothetical protein